MSASDEQQMRGSIKPGVSRVKLVASCSLNDWSGRQMLGSSSGRVQSGHEKIEAAQLFDLEKGAKPFLNSSAVNR